MTHGTLSRGRTGRVTATLTVSAPADAAFGAAHTGRVVADLSADTHGGSA